MEAVKKIYKYSVTVIDLCLSVVILILFIFFLTMLHDKYTLQEKRIELLERELGILKYQNSPKQFTTKNITNI